MLVQQKGIELDKFAEKSWMIKAEYSLRLYSLELCGNGISEFSWETCLKGCERVYPSGFNQQNRSSRSVLRDFLQKSNLRNCGAWLDSQIWNPQSKASERAGWTFQYRLQFCPHAEFLHQKALALLWTHF